MSSHSAELRSKFFGFLTPKNDKPVEIPSNEMDLSHLRVDETVNRRNNRPSSGPEIDDLEPGVDEGLLPSPGSRRPLSPGVDDGLLPEFKPDNGSRRPSFTPSQPGGDYNPTLGGYPTSVGNGFDAVFPRTPNAMDVNVYQQKKTLAQGMMDIALLSANANQLRYLLDYRGPNPYFYLSLSLISISLIFQIAVGVGLILNSRYNIKRMDDRDMADKVNNFTVIGIFIVTLTNVFVSAFGVTDSVPAKFSDSLVDFNSSEIVTTVN